jgi:2'-5' RNA ligase
MEKRKSVFLAVVFDDSFHAQLGELFHDTSLSGVRLIPVENYHITLGFIQSVPVDDHSHIAKVFEAISHEQPFEASFCEYVFLGPHHNVVGLKAEPHEKFQHLNTVCKKRLADNTDYRVDESHEYIPHTTIMTFDRRIRNDVFNDNIKLLLEKKFQHLRFKVLRLALMCRRGEHFEALQEYRLKS